MTGFGHPGINGHWGRFWTWSGAGMERVNEPMLQSMGMECAGLSGRWQADRRVGADHASLRSCHVRCADPRHDRT